MILFRLLSVARLALHGRPRPTRLKNKKRQKISPVLQAKALKQYVLTNKNKQTDRQTSKRTENNNNNKESLSVDAQSCTAESRKPGRYAAQTSSE